MVNDETSKKCVMHPKHEMQITDLEKSMDKAVNDIQLIKDTKAEKTDVQQLKDGQRDPRIWIAIIGFVSVCMSTCGSICAVLITAYFKIGAPTP